MATVTRITAVLGPDGRDSGETILTTVEVDDEPEFCDPVTVSRVVLQTLTDKAARWDRIYASDDRWLALVTELAD